jgi:MoxR-like ATPase
MQAKVAPNQIKSAEQIADNTQFVGKLTDEIGRVVVGQKYLVERLVISLLANGHVLVEGVPGLAKTTVIKTLAQALNASFQRIQFTPDLLPSDLIGTQVFNPKSGDFSVKTGPIFANLILADEINRAPSKVQSALLEAMQEKQVTISGETHDLPKPFFVLATQNPLEQEGTYPLPEAQIDRFMMKLKVDYPSRQEEMVIMERMSQKVPAEVNPVVTLEQLLAGQDLLDDVFIDEKVKNYILDLVCATRTPEKFGLKLGSLIQFGASPRACICLNRAARALAVLRGRGFVTPQDVKTIYPDVVRHRIILSYEAEAEEMNSDHVLQKILDHIDVP